MNAMTSGSISVCPPPAAGTGDDAAKRRVERIRHRHDELHKSGAAARRQQGQQEAQSQQRVDHKEDVVDDLRDARQTAGALDFTFSIDDFVDGLGAKLSGDLVDSSRLARGRRLVCAARQSLPEPFLRSLTLRSHAAAPASILRAPTSRHPFFPSCK